MYAMQHFDINKVIQRYGLDKKELAQLLFSKVKYPALALNRVLLGKANLDTKQLETLANYLGLDISDLFTDSPGWKGVIEQGSVLTFVKGEYTVRVNYNGSFLTLFKGDKVVAQNIINTTHLTITAFFELVDNLILTNKN